MEYYCAARKCVTLFYKGLQKDPKGDCLQVHLISSKLWGVLKGESFHCNAKLSVGLLCSWITMDSHSKIALPPWLSCFFFSAKFDQMKDCVVKVMKYCANSLPDSTIRRIVDDNFPNKECSEGPTLISSSSAASPLCSSSFVTEANACGRTFRQIFVADKSNSSLCAWVCVNYLFSYNKLYPTRILSGCYLWCKRTDYVNAIHFASLLSKANRFRDAVVLLRIIN